MGVSVISSPSWPPPTTSPTAGDHAEGICRGTGPARTILDAPEHPYSRLLNASVLSIDDAGTVRSDRPTRPRLPGASGYRDAARTQRWALRQSVTRRVQVTVGPARGAPSSTTPAATEHDLAGGIGWRHGQGAREHAIGVGRGVRRGGLPRRWSACNSPMKTATPATPQPTPTPCAPRACPCRHPMPSARLVFRCRRSRGRWCASSQTDRDLNSRATP